MKKISVFLIAILTSNLVFADTNNLSYQDMQDKNSPKYQDFAQNLNEIQQSSMLEKMDKSQADIRQKYPNYDPNMCKENVDLQLVNTAPSSLTAEQIAEIQKTPKYKLFRSNAIKSCSDYILKGNLVKIVNQLTAELNTKKSKNIDYSKIALTDFPYIRSIQNNKDNKIVILFNDKVADFKGKKLVLTPTYNKRYQNYELLTKKKQAYDYLTALESQ